MRRLIAYITIFVSLVAVVHSNASASLGYEDSFFDSTELKSSNLSGFKKWQSTLIRYFNQKKDASDFCLSSADENSYSLCSIPEWERIFRSVKDMGLKSKVERVQYFLNMFPYVVDDVNWGISDFWETPNEFAAFGGDCEDYAISKFVALRSLGVPNDAMRIAIVEDSNLNVLHAVLIVYIAGEPWVLDNQISQIVPASQIHHYQPIYSINETNWWRHNKR